MINYITRQLRAIVDIPLQSDESNIHIEEDHPDSDIVVVSDFQFSWLASYEKVRDWIETNEDKGVQSVLCRECREDGAYSLCTNCYGAACTVAESLWSKFIDAVPPITTDQAVLEYWEMRKEIVTLHLVDSDEVLDGLAFNYRDYLTGEDLPVLWNDESFREWLSHGMNVCDIGSFVCEEVEKRFRPGGTYEFTVEQLADYFGVPVDHDKRYTYDDIFTYTIVDVDGDVTVCVSDINGDTPTGWELKLHELSELLSELR